jgi:NADPH:quinone reductase-like Zn-dependent oxidoreductase
MRQVVFPKRNQVAVKDVADPTPGANEVLVAVEAAGVNFADTLVGELFLLFHQTSQ